MFWKFLKMLSDISNSMKSWNVTGVFLNLQSLYNMTSLSLFLVLNVHLSQLSKYLSKWAIAIEFEKELLALDWMFIFDEVQVQDTTI